MDKDEEEEKEEEEEEEYITLSRQMDGKEGRKKEMQSEYTY